ncbi:hypothetical protein CHLRE_10g444150v5 [Chlamydomonas reinhardtii]|uniref:Uncharacterized protein n=1 Tax=Chlamydomonas reinhardtii TaxID=3055 RepID=A8IHZ7_CHLRE|nr:uncharacterized protein CHLRE_10g444150v5 [Chlamydomonas reinhardtii]PNW77607.1 hypothetical protein CHLRE_10g444150v5 [Chlamydomonas reinhardtii]|eukprot:XP_001690498.1 predicted protein [Chlamydomonas reinhardtii]
MGIVKDVAIGIAIGATLPIWGPFVAGNKAVDVLLHALRKKPTKLAPSLEGEYADWRDKKCIVENARWQVFNERVRKRLPHFESEKYNIAFVGDVKAGKSSLVNAVRGMPDWEHPGLEDPYNKQCDQCGIPRMGKAAVDYAECTMACARYATNFPDSEHMIIWDVPGAGTEKHTAASYYQDKALYAFDCLILVTGDAFREVDRHILLEAQRRKQAVAIVRSKCDTTVQACLKRDRTKTPEAAVQEFQTRYKRELRERLGRLGVDASKVKVFLVNRFAFTQPDELAFDEADLIKWLAMEISKKH